MNLIINLEDVAILSPVANNVIVHKKVKSMTTYDNFFKDVALALRP